VSQGIGVRYTASGARVLGLERSEGGYRVTGVAAGPPGESVEAFLRENGFQLPDAVVACGLCPGDFLSAFVTADEGSGDFDRAEHLRWEIERKMISAPSEYSVDFAVADLGFVFAARKDRIRGLRGTLTGFVTDVEPVALYNGCDTAGEIKEGRFSLVAVEAEGISTVLLDNGELMGMESFPIREEDLLAVIPRLDVEGMKGLDDSASERLAEYALESVNRMSLRGFGEDGGSLDGIVVAGGGVYVGELPSLIETKSGVKTTVSNPFSALAGGPEETDSGAVEMSAAFTTCFGLAVRALEA